MPKAAFVALTGRPSVGKSTLVNLICGAKVAIVSSVPQTTRNAIRGILSRPEGQLVFVDTPGRHVSEKKLNKKLMDLSDKALDDSELVLYILDAARAPGPEEEEIAKRLKGFQDRTVAAVNKTLASTRSIFPLISLGYAYILAKPYPTAVNIPSLTVMMFTSDDCHSKDDAVVFPIIPTSAVSPILFKTMGSASSFQSTLK